VSEKVVDARVLRAIAHPVRNRILGELTATGSMRAADIARELSIPANQASFHLRQLAKYGLVEEDPEAARDKRDRVWRATNDDGLTIDVEDLAAQPGGRAAAQVFMRTSAAWAHAVVDDAYGVADREPGVHRSTTDLAVRLTEDEARELTTEMSDLLGRWTARTRGADGERRTYLVHLMVLPHPELPGAPVPPAEDVR
jgi:DNA-binding transcriptional ArsR family regulator